MYALEKQITNPNCNKIFMPFTKDLPNVWLAVWIVDKTCSNLNARTAKWYMYIYSWMTRMPSGGWPWQQKSWRAVKVCVFLDFSWEMHCLTWVVISFMWSHACLGLLPCYYDILKRLLRLICFPLTNPCLIIHLPLSRLILFNTP